MEYFDEDEAILISFFFSDMACRPRLGTCLGNVSERCGVTVGRLLAALIDFATQGRVALNRGDRCDSTQV